MGILSNTVNYLDGDVQLQGFFAFDDQIQGARPGVLICPTWVGRNKFVDEKAVRLAELGYLAFAVDMYGLGKLGEGKEECSALMQPFIDYRSLIVSRVGAACQALRQMPWLDSDKIACIGFCFGGLCVLDFARSGADISAVVSFHGLLFAPQKPAESDIKSKVLILHGHDDPMVNKEDVEAIQLELTRSGVDWQLHSYGHTMHAFTNPLANDVEFGTVYQENSDHRSWQSMVNFFSEVF